MATSTPEDVLNAYVKAFESLVPENVVKFYGLPCVFVSPMGVVPVTSAAEATQIVTGLVAQARSQNYARTEIPTLAVQKLGQSLAILMGQFIRFDEAGNEISRFGFSYTMKRRDDSWEIVVALGHEL